MCATREFWITCPPFLAQRLTHLSSVLLQPALGICSICLARVWGQRPARTTITLRRRSAWFGMFLETARLCSARVAASFTRRRTTTSFQRAREAAFHSYRKDCLDSRRDKATARVAR